MNFGLSQEISKDVLSKGKIIQNISHQIEGYFSDKYFGHGVKDLTIGIICVAPEFEFFFKERRKYSKNKSRLEYDVKVPHNCVENSSVEEIKKSISKHIINSLGVVKDLNIPDFDFLSFSNVVQEFF
jgi:hypothetical protein